MPRFSGEDLLNELTFSAVRSSGSGGQNVNKLNTKVELRFNVSNSQVLSDAQKLSILTNLKNKISSSGDIIIVAQSTKSQLQNKQLAVSKLIRLLEESLKPRKARRATRPSRASREKRLETKRNISRKKVDRKRID